MMAASLTCTNKGCGQSYFEAENTEKSCQYHSGPPIFHEGLKGYQCCSKRVTDFDDFLKIPGCATGPHSNVTETSQSSKSSAKSSAEDLVTPNQVSSDGKTEIYGQQSPDIAQLSVQSQSQSSQQQQEKKEILIDQDPENIQVKDGQVCKRNGCGYSFKNDEISRGSGSEAVCEFHPGVPVFHEGSKGWSCCSRKVLEFDEFLKIKGCRKDKHLFVGSEQAVDGNADQSVSVPKAVQVRHDWFQSPGTVTISFYAKKVDPSTVTCNFEAERFILSFTNPQSNDIFTYETNLFQPIQPEQSSFKVMSTKIELILKKANGISWPSIEPTNNVQQWTTFGIHGRTGTVGAKEMYVSNDSPILALNR